MFKKTFVLILLLITSSCGYEAINSQKNLGNYNFSIKELALKGDRTINIKIKEKLNRYVTNEKDKEFILNISSITEKIILAKNNSGSSTSFKITITLAVTVLVDDILKNNLVLSKNFNYNNIDNKIDLERYEKEIKFNLTENLIDDLIFKLSNIR